MACVFCPPAGSVAPRSVSSRPLLQPQLSRADPRSLPRIFPLQSEEPDHQDPAGEQVGPLLIPTGPFLSQTPGYPCLRGLTAVCCLSITGLIYLPQLASVSLS